MEKSLAILRNLQKATDSRIQCLEAWISANKFALALSQTSSSTATTQPTPTPTSSEATTIHTLPSQNVILWKDITIGEELGSGSFGNVHRGIVAGKPVAVKISNSGITQERIDLFFKEMDIIMNTSQPRAIQFFGTSLSPQGSFVIISELMKGDLAKLIIADEQRPVISIDRKLVMLHDVADGLCWLHTIKHGIHHDLSE